MKDKRPLWDKIVWDKEGSGAQNLEEIWCWWFADITLGFMETSFHSMHEQEQRAWLSEV